MDNGDEGDRAVIESGLTDPEQFHCISRPLVNSWPRDFETHNIFLWTTEGRYDDARRHRGADVLEKVF